MIKDYKKIIEILEKKVNKCEFNLVKIRAEILEEIVSHSGTGEEVTQAYVDGLKKGLAIIDKYRG